jgi:hypothetical protein
VNDGPQTLKDLESYVFDGLRVLEIDQYREILISDLAIHVCLRDVYEVVRPHAFSVAATYLIGIGSEDLIRLKVEFHVLICKHLCKHRALLHQIHKYEESLADFDQMPVYLDSLLYLGDEFCKGVLARLKIYLVHLVLVIFTNVHDFERHR